MILAVIPARGGSKRIPLKNIKPFLGRPIISYSIDAAKESGLFDRIIVSTDDIRIAEVARECGADVPFLRPLELADDYTGTAAVVIDALDELERLGFRYNMVCCIYATAPFLLPEYLLEGFNQINSGMAPSAFSVTTFPSPIFRALRKEKDGTIEMLWPEHRMTRSQDLQETYHDAAQFYWANVESFRHEQRFSMPGVRPVVIPRYMVQDIDTHEDWERAELMYKAWEHRRPQ